MDKRKALNTLSDMMERLQPDVRDIADIVWDIIRDDDAVKVKNLSLHDALEAARDGKRVRHESWSKRSYMTQVGDCFVRTEVDSDRVDDRIRITTEMLTGWIVLDR